MHWKFVIAGGVGIVDRWRSQECRMYIYRGARLKIENKERRRCWKID